MESKNNCNLRKLFSNLSSEEEEIDFAMSYKLIPDKSAKKCVSCKSSDSVNWQRRAKYSNYSFCLKCKKCKQETSITHNTWFENTKITIRQSLVLIYMWLLQTTLQIAASEAEVHFSTALDYFCFCREICYVIITQNTKPIGGEGHIVELDETHVYTRKYKMGRLLKNEKNSVWVFGDIDRETKESFVLKVEKRDKNTLIPIIKSFIKPHTKIMTDRWKSYSDLKDEGYIHEVVNHSIEFVREDDRSVHTQKVERMWKTLKSVLKREGRESENDHLYVFEFLYREQQKLKGMTTPSEMFPQFLQHIHDTYPGYGIEGLKRKDYIPQQ